MVDLYEEFKKNLRFENLSNLEANLDTKDDSSLENDTINSEKNSCSNNNLDIKTIDTSNSDSEVTNCLSLTVKKDYSLSIMKNVFIKTFKTTWRVIVSVLTLNILKFFF